MFGIRDFYVVLLLLLLLLLFMDLSAFCTVIKMLINLCGSFDMDTVIGRSFDFSFRYLVQRFTHFVL